MSSLRFRHGGYTRQNRLGARLWWGDRAPSHFTAADLSLFAFARLRLEPFVCAPCSTAMRKSVKRGEPQIYPVCVTLWASAGGVVGSRAFAVPRPRGTDRKQKRATGPRRIGRGVGTIFFQQRKRASRKRGRKKAVTRPLTLACRIVRPPEPNTGGRGEDLSPSPSVRQPNDCCPRKRHVWGTRRAGPQAAVSNGCLTSIGAQNRIPIC